MSDRFERGAVIVLCLAATVMAATLARRELGVTRSQRVPEGPPTLERDWEALSAAGIVLSNPGGSIRVLEFADFECPYCRRFDSTMRVFEATNHRTVSRLFIHDPLKMHRFAIPAARAAECANEQSKFSAMHDVLYLKQDSLGLKPWVSYALEAGVGDGVRFERCLERTSKYPRIESGMALAEKYQVRATPTVIINGWRFPRPPSDSVLLMAIRNLEAGKDPVVR